MRNWINIWRFEAWLNPAVFHLRHKHCHHLIKNSNGINDAPFLSGTKIDGLHKWYECQLLEESNIEFNSFSVVWLLAIISRHTQHKDRDSIDGGTRIRSDIIINEEHISFFSLFLILYQVCPLLSAVSGSEETQSEGLYRMHHLCSLVPPLTSMSSFPLARKAGTASNLDVI